MGRGAVLGSLVGDTLRGSRCVCVCVCVCVCREDTAEQMEDLVASTVGLHIAQADTEGQEGC